MKKKWDKMLRYRILALLCIAVVVLFAVLITAILIAVNSGDYNGKNKTFARISDTSEVKTKTFVIEELPNLLFFSDSFRAERTLFTDAIPNLKIVNSDRYAVEVTANSALLDLVEIVADGENNCLTFKTESYGNAESLGREYKGLYVDCTQFDVTVYAPISKLVSSAEINLDFEASSTKELIAIVSGEVREGRIYNVSSDVVGCNFQGSSNVKIEGEARTILELVAQHDTKIDASGMQAENTTIVASCKIFGFSSITFGEQVVKSVNDTGFMLSIILMVVPAVAIVLGTVFMLKFLKYKKFVDEAIDNNEF